MKTMLALLIVSAMSGCSALQNVGDLFAGVDKLNAECHVGVTKLGMKGINIYTIAQCDAAAAKAKAEIQKLVEQVRAELTKAGV
jgi:hypothetical protein